MHVLNTGISSLIFVVSITSIAGAAFILSFLMRRFRTVAFLTELLGLQYGFVRKRYEANYDIAKDGSSKASITELIRAINVAVSGVEHYSQILTDRTADMSPFTISAVDLNGEQKMSSKIQIIPKATLSTARRLYYQLLYEPMLQPGQEIEYSYEVLGPPSTFAISQEDLFVRRLPFDFISMKIAYPTEKFIMRIQFPAEIRIEDIKYDVWLGDARLRLENEYRRLGGTSSLKIQRLDKYQVAELVVTYPILDLKYAITWRPDSN